MKTLELRTADGRCIARQVRMACSFGSRCVGLLRHRSIPEQEGLLLVPGGSIHTLGMRFSIDVVFLNCQMRVLELMEQVPPWRVCLAPRGTGRVLELAAGKIAATRLTPGTYLLVDSTEPGERSTSTLPRFKHTPCERSPIQFSLRLTADRRCTAPVHAKCSAGARALRTPPPCRRELDSRATMPPNAGT